jgi:RNA polymerase sigma-70 factor (ECF subfamily)
MTTLTRQETTPEDELVARLSSDDEAAFRELYARHASLVYGVAARLLPPAKAEEIVQEVFLTLWRKHETYDPKRGSLRQWLSRIAKNRALNELRRDATRAEIPTDADTLDAIAGDGPEPAEAAWAERRRLAVRAAVETLPEAQRRALSLAFLEDLTHEQVAAALETPLGTAKTRIRSALRRLAPILAATLAVTVLVLAWRRAEREEKEERALVVVTSSDVTPRRLEAAAGVPAEAHGQFRGRAGSPTAVLTLSKLPALGRGERYIAWARHGEQWIVLGDVTAGGEQRSLLVAEDDALAVAIDEVRVTRETGRPATPTGAVVVSWPR